MGKEDKGKSKDQIEMETWRYLKDCSQRVINLIILERVFNNADYALRMRQTQTAIEPTIAKDFDELLIGRDRRKANKTYDLVAREMRRFGAWVSKKNMVKQVVQMEIESLKAKIDLNRQNIDKRGIHKRLLELRREMRRRKVSRKKLKERYERRQ